MVIFLGPTQDVEAAASSLGVGADALQAALDGSR